MSCKDCVRKNKTGVACECVICNILLGDHLIFLNLFSCIKLYSSLAFTNWPFRLQRMGKLADEELTTAGQVNVAASIDCQFILSEIYSWCTCVIENYTDIYIIISDCPETLYMSAVSWFLCSMFDVSYFLLVVWLQVLWIVERIVVVLTSKSILAS